MTVPSRLAELQNKQSRAGLTEGEKKEFLALQTAEVDARFVEVNKEKLKQRIAGRKAAETIVDLCRGECEPGHGPDWARGFFDTLKEFLDRVYNQPQPLFGVPMTDAEARKFGETLMEFGKFAGHPIADIERSYLDWLCGQQIEFSRRLSGYLKNEKIAAELENEMDARYDDWD